MRENSNVRLLAIHNFLVGSVPFAPIAILYFQRVSGSFALGMSVFSMIMLSAAFFEIPTGILSDKIGRKLTIVLGSASYLLSYILYALGFSYFFLVLGAIFSGLGRAFYSGNNNALLYDTLREHNKEERFDHYFGKVSSSEHIALAISALLGGVVAHFSFSLAMWLSTIPQLINLIISFKFYEPKVKTKKIETNIYAHFSEAMKNFTKNKGLMLLTLSGVIGFAVGESAFQFRAAFVEQFWPIWAIGVLSVLIDIGASVSFYYSGTLLKKLGAKFILINGKIYSRIITFLALAFPTVLSPLIMASTTLIYGASSSARAKLFQQEFTHHQRATMDSIKSLFNNLGFGVASLGIGLMADAVGPTRSLLYAQFLLVIPIFVLVKFFRLKRG